MKVNVAVIKDRRLMQLVADSTDNKPPENAKVLIDISAQIKDSIPQLDSVASSGSLIAGEVYYITEDKLLAIALTDSTYITYSLQPLRDDVTAIKDKLDTLADTSTTQLQADITDIKGLVEVITNTDIANLQIDVTDIKGKVDTLSNTDITQLESNVSDIKLSVESLANTDISQLQSDITEIKAIEVSNVDYTIDRSVKLDNLDVLVSSRLSTVVKSIKRGLTTIASGQLSVSVTLSEEVNMAKSQLSLLGVQCLYSSPAALVTIELIDSSTIKLTRQSSTNPAVVSWELVEFN